MATPTRRKISVQSGSKTLAREAFAELEFVKLTRTVEQWMNSIVKYTTVDIDINPNYNPFEFYDLLKDGLWLCRTAIALSKTEDSEKRPHWNAEIGNYFARENIAIFLEIAKELGCPMETIFSPEDLVSDHPNYQSVLSCLLMLRKLSSSEKTKRVSFIVDEDNSKENMQKDIMVPNMDTTSNILLNTNKDITIEDDWKKSLKDDTLSKLLEDQSKLLSEPIPKPEDINIPNDKKPEDIYDEHSRIEYTEASKRKLAELEDQIALLKPFLDAVDQTSIGIQSLVSELSKLQYRLSMDTQEFERVNSQIEDKQLEKSSLEQLVSHLLKELNALSKSNDEAGKPPYIINGSIEPTSLNWLSEPDKAAIKISNEMEEASQFMVMEKRKNENNAAIKISNAMEEATMNYEKEYLMKKKKAEENAALRIANAMEEATMVEQKRKKEIEVKKVIKKQYDAAEKLADQMEQASIATENVYKEKRKKVEQSAAEKISNNMEEARINFEKLKSNAAITIQAKFREHLKRSTPRSNATAPTMDSWANSNVAYWLKELSRCENCPSLVRTMAHDVSKIYKSKGDGSNLNVSEWKENNLEYWMPAPKDWFSDNLSYWLSGKSEEKSELVNEFDGSDNLSYCLPSEKKSEIAISGFEYKTHSYLYTEHAERHQPSEQMTLSMTASMTSSSNDWPKAFDNYIEEALASHKDKDKLEEKSISKSKVAESGRKTEAAKTRENNKRKPKRNEKKDSYKPRKSPSYPTNTGNATSIEIVEVEENIVFKPSKSINEYKTPITPKIKLKVPVFSKVSDLEPEMKGVNIKLFVIENPKSIAYMRNRGRKWRQHKRSDKLGGEVLAGDSTGCCIVELDGEQYGNIHKGDSIILRNGRIEMRKGYMRLRSLQPWSFIEMDTTSTRVKASEKKNNVSSELYELVEVKKYSLLDRYHLGIDNSEVKSFVFGNNRDPKQLAVEFKEAEKKLKKLKQDNLKLKQQYDALSKLDQQIEKKRQGIVEVKEEKKEEVDIAKIRDLFNLYDTDKSGYIDAAELEFLVNDLGQPMTSSEIIAILNELDTSKDKKIQFDEFLDWWIKPRPSSSRMASTNMLLKARLKAKAALRKLSSVQVQHEIKEQLDEGPATITLEGTMGAEFENPKMTMSLGSSFLNDVDKNSFMNKYSISEVPLAVIIEFPLKDGITEDEMNSIDECLIPINEMLGAFGEEFDITEFTCHTVRDATPKLLSILKFATSPLELSEDIIGFDPNEIFSNFMLSYSFAHDLSHLLEPNAKLYDMWCFKSFLKCSLVMQKIAYKIAESQSDLLYTLLGLFRFIRFESRIGEIRPILDKIYEMIGSATVSTKDTPTNEELLETLANGDSVDMSEEEFQQLTAMLATMNEDTPLKTLKEYVYLFCSRKGLVELNKWRIELLNSISEAPLPNISTLIQLIKQFISFPTLIISDISGLQIRLESNNLDWGLFFDDSIVIQE